jgi:hypothetical protein
MIRQLGLPTWFGSFSSADTKWIYLLRILGKLKDGKDYSDLNLFVFWCLFNPNQNMNVLGTSAEILLYRNNLLLCQLDSDHFSRQF